jgi:hypothetical protein
MAKDKGEIKVRVPKSVTKRTVQRTIKAVSEGRSTKELEGYLHDGDQTQIYFMRAEIAFLTDPLFRPPEFFYTLMRGTVNLQTYRERVVEDRWEAQREKVKAQAKAELVRRVSSHNVKEQVREAEQISQLRGWLFELLTPSRNEDGSLEWKVQPKSLEGCIKAFQDVSVLLQMYRQTVLQQIEPHAPVVVDEESVSRGPFTDEEAGQIAEQLLRKRYLTEGKKDG